MSAEERVVVVGDGEALLLPRIPLTAAQSGGLRLNENAYDVGDWEYEGE